MGHKAAEITHNIEMHLAQELLKNVQCHGGSSSFVKETRPLRMRRSMASHQSWQWPIQRIIEADPPTTTQEVTKELNFSHSTVIQHLKQIWKVKKLDKWVSHELTEKKNHCFEVSSSVILHNNEPFFNRIMTRNKKRLLYDNWRRLVQWEAPKHFPKLTLHQEKLLATVWWSAA